MDYKDLGNGRYSFVMPASPFQVHVNFVLSDPLVYPYEDPAPYYATTAASYLYAAGIMQGTSETTFSPYAPMTRAMVATVLYRMAGEPAVSGDVTFSDVPADTWYTQAVAWAQEKGVIQGTSPTTFSPDSQVTRSSWPPCSGVTTAALRPVRARLWTSPTWLTSPLGLRTP